MDRKYGIDLELLQSFAKKVETLDISEYNLSNPVIISLIHSRLGKESKRKRSLRTQEGMFNYLDRGFKMMCEMSDLESTIGNYRKALTLFLNRYIESDDLYITSEPRGQMSAEIKYKYLLSSFLRLSKSSEYTIARRLSLPRIYGRLILFSEIFVNDEVKSYRDYLLKYCKESLVYMYGWLRDIECKTYFSAEVVDAIVKLKSALHEHLFESKQLDEVSDWL